MEALTSYFFFNFQLGFDDVLAEPAHSQGIEGVWRLAFLVFGGAKLWVYRIVAAVVALPLALLWGAVFGFVTVFHVWFGAPAIRLLEFVFYVVRRVSRQDLSSLSI